MPKKGYTKVVVDWRAVTTEVNRELSSDYTPNYLQAIRRRTVHSRRIQPILDRILGPAPKVGEE